MEHLQGSRSNDKVHIYIEDCGQRETACSFLLLEDPLCLSFLVHFEAQTTHFFRLQPVLLPVADNMDVCQTDTASDGAAHPTLECNGKFEPLPALTIEATSPLSCDFSFEEDSVDYTYDTDDESSNTTQEDDIEAPKRCLLPDDNTQLLPPASEPAVSPRQDFNLPVWRIPFITRPRPPLYRASDVLRSPPGLSRRRPLPPPPPPKITLTPFGLSPEARRKLRAWQPRRVIHPHTDQLITQPAGFHASFYNANARGTPGDRYAEQSQLHAPWEKVETISMRGLGRKLPVMFWSSTDEYTRERIYLWEINGRRSCLDIERANTFKMTVACSKEYEPQMKRAWETKVSGRRGGVLRPLVSNAVPVKQLARDFLKWGTLKLKESGNADLHLPRRLLDMNRRRLEPKTFTLVMRSANIVDNPHQFWPRYKDGRNNYFLFPRVGRGAMWGPAPTPIGRRRVGADWRSQYKTPSPTATPSIVPIAPPHELLLLRDGLELNTNDDDLTTPPGNDVDIAMPDGALLDSSEGLPQDANLDGNSCFGHTLPEELGNDSFVADPLSRNAFKSAGLDDVINHGKGAIELTPHTDPNDRTQTVRESLASLTIADSGTANLQLGQSPSGGGLGAGVIGESSSRKVSSHRRTISDLSDDGGVHLDLTDEDSDTPGLLDLAAFTDLPQPSHGTEHIAEIKFFESSSSSGSDLDEGELAEDLQPATQHARPETPPQRHIQATHRRFRLSPNVRHDMFIRRAWQLHRQQEMARHMAALFGTADAEEEL
jgi:hypothetical protein